jgi:hypothetical protein
MLGHQDIASDQVSVAYTDDFKFLLKNRVGGRAIEQRKSSITTECNEMKLPRVLIAD